MPLRYSKPAFRNSSVSWNSYAAVSTWEGSLQTYSKPSKSEELFPEPCVSDTLSSEVSYLTDTHDINMIRNRPSLSI